MILNRVSKRSRITRRALVLFASLTFLVAAQPAGFVQVSGAVTVPEEGAKLAARAAPSTIWHGQTVYAGGQLDNGAYKLVMQYDGNLVIYFNTNTAIWATMTNTSDSRLVMQAEGNLVVYRPNNTAAWSSGSSGVTASANPRAGISADGNLVVYHVFNSQDPAVAYQSGTSIQPYWASYKPSSLHRTWFISYDNSAYEDAMSWATSVLDAATEFSMTRTASSTTASVYAYRQNVQSNNNYAEVTCAARLNNDVCSRYNLPYNLKYGQRADLGPLYCHELGHTVGLWHGNPGESNQNVLDAEKSCMRGNPEVHKYGARHVFYANEIY